MQGVENREFEQDISTTRKTDLTIFTHLHIILRILGLKTKAAAPRIDSCLACLRMPMS